VRAGHFEPLLDRGLFNPLAAVALIFVAYEGFELIPNAIDEMRNPARDLRRSILSAILIPTMI
jgi:amino acid transporter